MIGLSYRSSTREGRACRGRTPSASVPPQRPPPYPPEGPKGPLPPTARRFSRYASHTLSFHSFTFTSISLKIHSCASRTPPVRAVPAPPRRVARKGGTSRNREAVPPWMGSSDHTTSLAPSRFSATRRGGAGTSRTYTTQPRSLTGSSRARRPRGPYRAGSRPCRRSSWHTAAASRRLRS